MQSGNAAILFLGNPKQSRRLFNHVSCFINYGYHVDILGYSKKTMPDWISKDEEVSYHYMDAAFLGPAPDNFFFFIVYPIQLFFDFWYTLFHLLLFCKSGLRVIVAMAHPFRPAAIFAARLFAKAKGIPFYLDVAYDRPAHEYTGSRAKMLHSVERNTFQYSSALVRLFRPSQETFLFESHELAEVYGVTRNLSVLPSLPLLAARGLNPMQRHKFLQKMIFAQPERTALGERTLFHYMQQKPAQTPLVVINMYRPLLITVPCGFKGNDDFDAVMSLAESLEGFFLRNQDGKASPFPGDDASLHSSKDSASTAQVSQERYVNFKSAIIVITGRVDPTIVPDTREYYRDVKERVKSFHTKFRVSDKESMLEEIKSMTTTKLPATVKREQAMKGRRKGAQYVRIHLNYLTDMDYWALLDCSDIVFVPRIARGADPLPTSLLDAVVSLRPIVTNVDCSAFKAGEATTLDRDNNVIDNTENQMPLDSGIFHATSDADILASVFVACTMDCDRSNSEYDGMVVLQQVMSNLARYRDLFTKEENWFRVWNETVLRFILPESFDGADESEDKLDAFVKYSAAVRKQSADEEAQRLRCEMGDTLLKKGMASQSPELV